MAFQFSDEEIQAVKNRYPKLELVNPSEWAGEFDLCAVYNGRQITDVYKISIIVSDSYPNEMPVLREVGGRTHMIAHKQGITDLRSLHHNPQNGTACLCVKQEEAKWFPPGSNLVTFLEGLVVFYLYALSSYEEEGKWPWKEYDHGGLGLLMYEGETPGIHTRETIMDILHSLHADKALWPSYRELLKYPKGQGACPCGSGRQFFACHRNAWAGIYHLTQSIRKLGMSPMALTREVEGEPSKI